jgi:hypothetical protein
MNGEWYEGGKFLPSTNLPKRSAARGNGGQRLQCIEPGVLAELPDGKRAIFPRIRVFVDQAEGGGLRIAERLNSPDHPVWAHHGPMEEIQALIARYNAGERFMDIA